MKLLNTPLLVSRTSSGLSGDQPPCEGAVRYQSKGTQLTHIRWTINFATLEELERFLDAHGEVVITPPKPAAIWPLKKEMGSIEIYDTWRE